MSLTILLLCKITLGQIVFNREVPAEGDIYLTPQIAIPKINPGYTVWLPDEGKINGLIVFTHPRRDTVNTDSLINYSLQNHLAVLYATTDNRLEFFFDKNKMSEIEGHINEVITKHFIPRENLLFCGMSLEGTRALKLTMFANSSDSKYRLKPKAIVLCDSPLDMIRLHKEMVKAKELNFNPITANEGTWVSGYLESNLGGTPNENFQAYVDCSPYCYSDDIVKNYLQFKDIAIRAYAEPDVNWWIDTRRKDYYSMNAIDMAALINELKIAGNENAELIITYDKGYLPDGTRHPHSWSIIDEQEMLEWFLNMIQ
ncbi:MAG: hypothetical protein OEM46_01930 [Ignavibacteria bacterium]|nr:hypothetical protein [Ignavibacteria bacterium]